MNDTITINGFEYASVAPEGGVQEWANGLPLVGRRELTRGERDELLYEQSYVMKNRHYCFFLLGATLLVSFAILSYITFSPLVKWTKADEGHPFTFSMINLFMSLCAISMVTYREKSRMESIDASGGTPIYVNLYKGKVSRRNWILVTGDWSSEAGKAIKTGKGDEYFDCDLEAFLASRRIWRVNGVRQKQPQYLSISVYSPIPGTAAMLTQPGETGEIRLFAQQELDELKRLDLKGNGWTCVFYFSLWEFFSFFRQHGSVHYKMIDHGFLILAVLCLVLGLFIMIRTNWRRFNDRRQGFVSLHEADGVVQEIMPCSKRVWSTDGKPADWRNKAVLWR